MWEEEASDMKFLGIGEATGPLPFWQGQLVESGVSHFLPISCGLSLSAIAPLPAG